MNAITEHFLVLVKHKMFLNHGSQKNENSINVEPIIQKRKLKRTWLVSSIKDVHAGSRELSLESTDNVPS